MALCIRRRLPRETCLLMRGCPRKFFQTRRNKAQSLDKKFVLQGFDYHRSSLQTETVVIIGDYPAIGIIYRFHEPSAGIGRYSAVTSSAYHIAY